jgi:cytochrome c553
MKRNLLVLLMVLAVAGFAAAQIQPPTSDVLGAHLNYGRGCAACHAPHSGAWGNGANKSHDTTSGTSILWGQDVGSLYGKQIITGSTNGSTGYVENLPANMEAGTPDVNGLLTCLSCHDGNWARGAMMKDAVYETLPATYGSFNTIPTLLGADGDGAGNYLANHPVGLNAAVSCGGQYNWDCTETNGVISMTGPNSSAFVKNYGFFVSLSAYNNTAVVMCTSCHNQHLMNVVKIGPTTQSGLPQGYYATMFFVRGPYNPASGTAGANQTAQFCRECHGGEANESNGSYTIPTTF